MSEHAHDRAGQLVKMANDIGNFFRFEPVREDAIAGIAKHIAAYWTNSMLRKMAAHGEAGLDDLPREALRQLASRRAAVPVPPPGGDAG
ncbi:MAG TPA: formate dehydrogenase subunit delta [Steroidobacteraceae bacterium]|jgi:formate dehydrogenase subunit delta